MAQAPELQSPEKPAAQDAKAPQRNFCWNHSARIRELVVALGLIETDCQVRDKIFLTYRSQKNRSCIALVDLSRGTLFSVSFRDFVASPR